MEEDFDLEDPMVVSDSDPIPSLFASESDHMASYVKTSDAQLSFRQDAIALILKVKWEKTNPIKACIPLCFQTPNWFVSRHLQLALDPVIAYLAVNYLDRFLSKQGIPKSEPWVLKLLSLSCASLAAKMKNSTFSLNDFQSSEGIIFDTRTISRMELLILSALKWRMRSVTPFAFLEFFLSFFKRNDPPLKQAVKDRATEILFRAQNEVKILAYKPSAVAASALLSASHELLPVQFPCFRKTIFSSVYINKEKLLDCYNLLQGVVMDGYLSIFPAGFSISNNPDHVLDEHCLESEKTSSISNEKTAMRSEGATKKRKTRDSCSSSETFHHPPAPQMQRC